MPTGPCDALEIAYLTAALADDAADLAVSSAEWWLIASEIAWAGGVIGEVACVLTVETGPGFIACEAAAFATAEGAAVAIIASEQGLEAAKINAELTQYAMEDALKAWCDCVEKNKS